MGAVSIQIPFTYLEVKIDVQFLMITEDIPSLLSMKDVVENGLEISIQGIFVSLGLKCHKLAMENYFLIHRWSLEPLP